MPDDSRGTEGDDLSLLLQSPAEIHVVSGFAVFGIEAADLFKGPFEKRHIAAGDVFGHHVGEQDVAGSAGRGRHTGLNPVLRWRRNVRSAHARVVTADERADEKIQPVRVRHAIAVGVGNDLALGRVAANIAGKTEALVFLADVDDPGVFRRDLLGVVLRPVIDENHLVVGIIHVLERLEAAVEGFGPVVRTNNNRDLRIARQRHLADHGCFVGEERLDGVVGFFRLTIDCGQSERPVGDVHPVAPPLIRPGVDERAGQSAAHHAFDMPLEHLGLFLLGVAQGVHAEFAHDERPVLGEILQPRQIPVEVLLPVEVHIEGVEIHVRRQQVFRGRIAGVGEEHVVIGIASEIDHVLDEFRDAAHAVPAHHRARDFVGHEVAHQSGMTGVGLHVGVYLVEDFPSAFSGIEEVHILPPPERDHHADAVFLGEIEEPFRRGVINADGVEPDLAHQSQIAGGFFGRADIIHVCVRLEGAVGDALQKKLLTSFKEELCASAHPVIHGATPRGRSPACPAGKIAGLTNWNRSSFSAAACRGGYGLSPCRGVCAGGRRFPAGSGRRNRPSRSLRVVPC